MVRALLFGCLMLATPVVARAQSADRNGPRVESARVGVAPVEKSAAFASTDAPAGPRLGESVALMVVGGAALVAGLVIGGDGGTILAIGGTVVGLVGLFRYLR